MTARARSTVSAARVCPPIFGAAAVGGHRAHLLSALPAGSADPQGPLPQGEAPGPRIWTPGAASWDVSPRAPCRDLRGEQERSSSPN